MLEAVAKAIKEDYTWPRSMVQQLEDHRAGSGFQWAAECVTRWIENTKPDGFQELLQLMNIVRRSYGSAANAAALGEEARRIWYLALADVFPQRAVSNFYAALAWLAMGSRRGYITCLSAGVYIATTKDTYAEDMYRDLQDSFRRTFSQGSESGQDDCIRGRSPQTFKG